MKVLTETSPFKSTTDVELQINEQASVSFRGLDNQKIFLWVNHEGKLLIKINSLSLSLAKDGIPKIEDPEAPKVV